MPRVPSSVRPQRLTPELVPRLQASSTRAERSQRAKAQGGNPFAGLTWQQQRAAEQWLWKFCVRWGMDLPNWRRAILIGVAKRLAVNPPASRFGKRLAGCAAGRASARSRQRSGCNPGYQVLLDRGTRLHEFSLAARKIKARAGFCTLDSLSFQ